MRSGTEELNLEGLPDNVSSMIEPFIMDILSGYRDNIHSIYIVGSSLTPDFSPKRSDINSVVVLNDMDLGFVEFVASLGKKYRKRNIAAPLIMTPHYIHNSLDVFPVEFLDLQLIHKSVYGEDILSGLKISRDHLRLQCEREVKSKLIWLRQGYISSLGDRRLLSERLSESITGYMPLFRAIIYLLGKEPPLSRRDVVVTLQELTGVETGIFERMLLLKRREINLSKDMLTASFEEYYRATERINRIVDELSL
jgi:predicted nucleotidyltransferase